MSDKIVAGLRPNVARILSDAADEALLMGLTRVGVMACGPTSLVMDARDQAFQQSQVLRMKGDDTWTRLEQGGEEVEVRKGRRKRGVACGHVLLGGA